MTSGGKMLSLGGPLPGSEHGRSSFDLMDWREAYGLGATPSFHQRLVTDGFRYLFFLPEPGPLWQLSDFDFDRDYKRFGLTQSLYDSGNPDLRQFKAAGGKLIIFQNLNDVSVLPQATIDYYQTVERTMGGRVITQEFARLFLLPGTQHCVGGDGAFAVDWLSHLETWVEKGEAPQTLLSAHVKLDDLSFSNPADHAKVWRKVEFPLDSATIGFTRPVYPYPTNAKYLGRGDPRDLANWGARRP